MKLGMLLEVPHRLNFGHSTLERGLRGERVN